MTRLIAILMALLISKLVNAQEINFYERLCTVNTTEEVSVKQLLFNKQLFGYAIWINEDTKPLKVEYFVKANSESSAPYSIIQKRSDPQDWLLLTSAGFVVNDYNKPLGLCAVNGQVLNYQLSRKMDGLVSINNGFLEVYNLNNQMTTFSSRGSIWNSRFKANFLQYVENNDISLFQTHLLTFENNMMIDPNARNKLAFRKILARVHDKNGSTHLVLYYIQQGVYLYDISLAIYKNLTQKDKRISFMINLDTGAHDVLQLNESISSCKGNHIQGFNNAYASNNLLLLKWD